MCKPCENKQTVSLNGGIKYFCLYGGRPAQSWKDNTCQLCPRKLLSSEQFAQIKKDMDR